MRQIGDELHSNTSAFLLPPTDDEPSSVLDLCMAPGGFTASILSSNPDARICGITLPLSQGGHEILLPNWQTDQSISVFFLDITMLAAEMDVAIIPREHPDVCNLLPDRPFCDERFDFVFCDGQVLRKHLRAEYRESREATRLLTSQLVLALRRIKVNGKIVVLLHKVDAWETVALLHALSKFSSLQLFKPVKKHATRSSFYAVAEHVQPEHEDALRAVASWKEEWRVATFGSDAEYLENRKTSNRHVHDVLLEFGAELIVLGGPIWKTQWTALRRASFLS